MSNLEATLQQALTLWHADLADARAAGNLNSQIDLIEARRGAVVVRHTTDLASLQAAGLDAGFDDHGVVSGVIFLRDVERLAAVPGVASIGLEPIFRPTLDGTVREMKVPWKVPEGTPWPQRDHQWSTGGAGVIVAIIDTGIDIFHESFRKPDGTTRILELWDQSATTGGVLPPATFPQTMGRVFNTTAINAGLTAGAPFASIDANGHGTHVAGIAAGNGRQEDRCSFPGRYVGVAPEADLLVVKAIALPPTATGSTREAMRWCAEARTRLPGMKAVVINGSFGSDTGPHDGAGPRDSFIDNLLRPGPVPGTGPPVPGLAIVIAAGNAGADEIHEEGIVAANDSSTVPFYIPDGSTTPNELDIWFTGASILSVEIIAPPNPAVAGSNTTGPVTTSTPSATPLTLGLMRIAVFFSGPSTRNGNRRNINITISAPANVSVRPGIWQIKLTESAGTTAAVWDAWFNTKHSDAYPTFKLPGDPEHTPRRRLNTINEPGTSRNAITVASYDNGDGTLADSSSRGPDLVPTGLPIGEYKPTIAAPGVGVRAPRSQNDLARKPSSCCDQQVVDLDGTSMAAPHVAGLVALLFEKNKTLTFEQVRAHLQRAARIDGIPAGEVPPIYDASVSTRANPLWGSGKVDAAKALADIPAIVAGGGGGGGGGAGGGGGGFPAPVMMTLGYTPHTLVSRLGDWQNRFGPRPGLMLFAQLVSEHVDEVLRLVNGNRRVGAVWRKCGGPLLVRRLLHGPTASDTLLPAGLEGCNVTDLLARFFPLLIRFGGPRLQADLVRFGAFTALLAGGNLLRLDEAALQFASGR